MRSWVTDSTVAVTRQAARYSSAAPYDPSEQYPEAADSPVSSEYNPAYRGVRSLFHDLGLDASRYGTANWNPLGELIQPGNCVVIKPNLVSHVNLGKRAWGLTDTLSLVTHGSVIRAVADYAARALGGRGTIVIGDCPLQCTSWEAVVELTHLNAIRASLLQRFPRIDVALRDFRIGTAETRGGRVVARTSHEDRRAACTEVDLGSGSHLAELNNSSFGVAQYGQGRMSRAHGPLTHRYLIPNEILHADVFLNLPKMKTHMKTGITGALKNLVGINGHKDYLPHFRSGSPSSGGDEYPDGNRLWHLMWWFVHQDWNRDRGMLKQAAQAAAAVCGHLIEMTGGTRSARELGGGSWHGNDTLWRTVLDINAALLYYDRKTGKVGPRPRSDLRYLSILDGLVGGHREGPLSPTPVASGYLAASFHPVALDAVQAVLMGFDPSRLRQLTGAYQASQFRLAPSVNIDDIPLAGLPGVPVLADLRRSRERTTFVPSRGYRGHIELNPEQFTIRERSEAERLRRTLNQSFDPAERCGVA